MLHQSTRARPDLVLLFSVCIMTRLFVAYTAATRKALLERHRYIIAAIGLSMGVTVMWIYANNLRQTTGAFDNKVWWNILRPVHAFLWVYFAFLVYRRVHNHAYVPLLLDATISAAVFVWYRMGVIT